MIGGDDPLKLMCLGYVGRANSCGISSPLEIGIIDNSGRFLIDQLEDTPNVLSYN